MTMLAAICSLFLVHMCAQANCATVIELSDFVTEYEPERFAGAMEQYGDTFLQLSRSPCKFKGDKCDCCLKHSMKVFGHRYHLNFCISLQILQDNKIKIELKEGRHHLYSKTFSLLKKIKECAHVPGVPNAVAKACLEFYDIDIKSRKICAKVVLEVLGKKKQLDFHCFEYPKHKDRMMLLNSGDFFLDEPEQIDMEAELESRDLD